METRLKEIRNQTAELLSEALRLIQTIRPDATRIHLSNRGSVHVWGSGLKSGYHPRSILEACDNLATAQTIRDERIAQLKSEIKKLEEDK
jgi:hypothetical protein